MKILKAEEKNIQSILDSFNRGEILIFPTDTIYGLLCDATNEKSVKRIFKIKNRPFFKPLPVFVGSFQKAQELAFIREESLDFLKKFWPGKLTAVLKVTPKGRSILSENVMKNDKVGLRIPDHSLLIKILKKIDKPLTATSANISGFSEESSLTDIEKVIYFFTGEKPDLAIDGGNLKKSKSSTVIDLSGIEPEVLRKGSVDTG